MNGMRGMFDIKSNYIGPVISIKLRKFLSNRLKQIQSIDIFKLRPNQEKRINFVTNQKDRALLGSNFQKGSSCKPYIYT